METALILDADGVVIRSDLFTVALEREHGIPSSALSDFFKVRFPSCIVGEADLMEELEVLLPEIGWKGCPSDFLEFWFEAENRPDRSLLQEVTAIRKSGLFVALGTNQERYRVAFMLNRMRFCDYFDSVFSSCDIGHRKPSEGFFAGVSEKLESKGIQRVVFFDDRADNVEAAAKAGWESYVYSSLADLERWSRKISEQPT